MAVEQDDQHTSDVQSAGEEGTAKLIFGKYKTMEEAEKAHKDLERNFHSGREEYSRLNERLELIENSRDEGYGRGQQHAEFVQQPDNTRVLTEFYQDPMKVLSEVESRATQRAKAELRREQQQNQDHSERVQAWLGQNQDVAPYSDLLTHWVGQTDGRLSIETRLNKAAEKVRQRVIELKGKPQAGDPKPEDVVEGVEQGGNAAGGKQSVKSAPQTDPESQLASYASSRNRQVRKPLGQPKEKA